MTGAARRPIGRRLRVGVRARRARGRGHGPRARRRPCPPFAHGVIEDRLPGRWHSPPPGLGAPGPGRLRRVDGRRRCARSSGRAAWTRRTWWAWASTSRPARCCRRPPTARPCAGCPSCAPEPHAWVKLWKHHAAQPEADRINALAAEPGRAVAAALRRPHLVRVVPGQVAPDPRRGTRYLRRGGPAHRGRRLDRVAAHRGRDAQQLHRRLQGAVVATRWLPGRRLPGCPRPAVRGPRGQPDVAGRPRHRRACRASEREAAALDRPASRDAGRHRQRRCPRVGARGAA